MEKLNRIGILQRNVVSTAGRYKVSAHKVRERKENLESSLWVTFVMIVLVSLMVCIAVNLRASNELSEEIERNQVLNEKLSRLLEENKRLQEDIQKLKVDPVVIEREARKLGMGLPNEKVLVSAN